MVRGKLIILKKITISLYSWSQKYFSIRYYKKDLTVSYGIAVDFNNY